MADAEIKGAGFSSLLAAMREKKGAAFVERVLARVPDEALHARLRTNSILPAHWLPIAWYRSVLRAAVDAGLTDTELRDVSRSSATRDVTGLYRVVFAVLSAELLAKQSARLVGLFYRGGAVKPVDVRPGYALVEYEGWSGFDALVWRDYMFGTEAVFELAGAKDVRTRVEAGGDAASMRAVAEWR